MFVFGPFDFNIRYSAIGRFPDSGLDKIIYCFHRHCYLCNRRRYLSDVSFATKSCTDISLYPFANGLILYPRFVRISGCIVWALFLANFLFAATLRQSYRNYRFLIFVCFTGFFVAFPGGRPLLRLGCAISGAFRAISAGFCSIGWLHQKNVPVPAL